ncbi:MAG: hypothetical protein HXS52_04305 [Theionarchaea archaeon]|nr:hypothetical protein [Theionarchaea archaeon]
MYKNEILEILDTMIQSLTENPNQFVFQGVKVTGLKCINSDGGTGMHIVAGAPGSVGMKVTASAEDIDTRAIQNMSRQTEINQTINALEEFRAEICKERPNMPVLRRILETGERVLAPVISAILIKMLSLYSGS